MSTPARAFCFVGAGSFAHGHGQSNGLVLTPTGGVAMVEGDAAIRQAILLLLSTTPGERLMRPEYGSHLRRLLFAPNDQTTAGLAIHYVRQAIERWEPRVEVLEIDAERNPDVPEQLDISLRYLVKATLTADHLLYPIDLGGQNP